MRIKSPFDKEDPNDLNDIEIDVQDIKDAIDELDENSAAGPDGIPVILLIKKVSHSRAHGQNVEKKP